MCNPNEIQPANGNWTKVVIPQELIDALKPYGKRFIKISRPVLGHPKEGKKAFEPKFYDHPYAADDSELLRWLESGGNYGILCGDGIAEVDMDIEELQNKFEAIVNTFTVQSGRTGNVGKHALILTDATSNGSVNALPDENGKQENLGNIQVNHKYVVGPNSNHGSGQKYRIIRNVPIAFVTKKQLEDIFGNQISWAGQKLKESQNTAKTENHLTDGVIPIAEIIPNFQELTQIRATEFQGPHPIHGSETGQNFTVDTEKNCWYCFRCNSGGGPLLWLAVREKLITCAEAKPGALKGPLFQKVLAIGQKMGYKLDFGNVEKYFEGMPPHFVPAFLAEDLLKDFHYWSARGDNRMLVYNPKKGVYEMWAEDQIMEETAKRLGKYSLKNRQLEVLNYIQSLTKRDVEVQSPDLIAMQNGIFNLKTHEIKPPNPENLIFNQIPVKYDPNSICPTFMKFVNEVAHPSDILALQELMGYLFYGKYKFNKIFLFVGQGRNGKTTLLNVMCALLGNGNYSAVTLQDLLNRHFSTAELYGKLANIADDLTNEALKNTGKMKMFTGESQMMGERKFKDPFYFMNTAKIICACNEVPKTPDDTDAFFARIYPFIFPNQFREDDPKTDPDLIEKLTTPNELSGIFNWAIEGLDRLFKNKCFSNSKTIEQVRELYLCASNPLKTWVDENVEETFEGEIDADEGYRQFLLWCREKNIPPISKVAFGMSFSQFAPMASSQYTFDKIGQRHKIWRNVTLRSSSENKALHLPPSKILSLQVSRNSIDQYSNETTLVKEGNLNEVGAAEPKTSPVSDKKEEEPLP
jgi:putative DNA primase/helicase